MGGISQRAEGSNPAGEGGDGTSNTLLVAGKAMKQRNYGGSDPYQDRG